MKYFAGLWNYIHETFENPKQWQKKKNTLSLKNIPCLLRFVFPDFPSKRKPDTVSVQSKLTFPCFKP